MAAYKKDEFRNADYRFHGYELDAKRQPTFKWEYQGVKVEESYFPSGTSKDGNASLKRTVKFASPGGKNGLYFLALAGNVEEKGPDFLVDKVVKVTVAGGEPLVRKDGGRTEVLLPVEFKDGRAEFTLTYAWNAK